MAQPFADEHDNVDARFAEAVLQYLEARETDLPLNDDTWVASHPVEIRPALRSFLANRAIVAEALRGLTTPSDPIGVKPFGCYQDFEFLAQGGIGAIYRCKDSRLERPIAIKVMHQRLMAVAEMPLRFRQEAQVAAQLVHPNIAPVHEMGELPDGRPYFTMKLVEGETLSVAIRDYHANPAGERFERLLRDFVSICNGVEYAHSRNVLHRDLKPANVMIGRFGEVQVMDWGLTKVLAPIDSQSGEPQEQRIRSYRGNDPYGESQPGVRGTPAYMPPEQALGSAHLDARCDVFALGAILCQILVGRPPYISDNPDPHKRTRELLDLAQRGVTGDTFALLEARGEPAELIALARQCLSFEPDRRPPTAGAVADAVTRYQAGAQRRAQEAELGKARAEARAASERRKRQWQLGAAGALLLLVTAAVSGGIWYQFDREAKRTQEAARAKEEQRLRDEKAAGVRIAIGDMYDALKVDQVARATASLASARGRLDSEAPNDLATMADQAGENLNVHLALERIRIEKGILTFDDTPIFDDTARAYARFFSQRGFDLADPELPRRLADSPIHRSLISALDDWATHERDPARQDQLFSVLREADPDSSWANRLRNREVRKNRAQLKALLDEVPWDNLSASSIYALLAAAENEPELASPLLQKAAVRFANDFWFNMATGTVLATQTAANPDAKRALRKKALGFFRTAVALRPDNDAALAVFALFTIEDGDFREAKLIVDRLENLPNPSWTKHMALGRLVQKQGRHRAAVDHYKKASELSDHIGSKVELAQAHLFVGELREAARVVDEILAHHPDHANVLPLKAVILAMQQKTDLAWPLTQRVLEANPRSMGGRVALFACLLQRGRFLDARRVLASFTPQERESESLGHIEFLFEIVRGDLERALTLMSNLPADTPTYAIDCFRVQALTNVGRLVEAKQLADKTLKAVAKDRVDLAALTGGAFSENSLRTVASFLQGILSADAAFETGPGPDMGSDRIKKAAPFVLVGTADMYLAKQRFHDALQIYEFVLPAGATAGGDRVMRSLITVTLMPGTSRFKAMRAAAQTLVGGGKQARPLNETERSHTRELARRWFQEEVDALRQVVGAIAKNERFAFDKKVMDASLDLHSLKMHRDLEPIRNPARIGEMPEKDRKQFQELWDEVDRLLLKLNPPIEWLKLPET